MNAQGLWDAYLEGWDPRDHKMPQTMFTQTHKTCFQNIKSVHLLNLGDQSNIDQIFIANSEMQSAIKLLNDEP